jgi:pimeloyl-ACP methyl ester carboxylesterase
MGYLVTPESYGRLSTRGAKITEETWMNDDGTMARGWLLRGSENAPAVILLHRYGADRSYVLDLGIKLNEATNYTILMPDQRGHGANPQVKYTSFGGCEAEDATTAIAFLRGLKTKDERTLVGENIGFYGVEMGAIAALTAASKDENIKALVLDSTLLYSDELLGSAVEKRFPFASSVTSKIAGLGTYPYFYAGCYQKGSLCEAAKSVNDRQVLLLAGSDSQIFQNSATDLKRCFPTGTAVELKTDLNPSGFNLENASIEQSSVYDQRVIEFFSRVLGSNFKRIESKVEAE